MQESDLFYERHPDPMWIFDLDTLFFLDVNLSAVATYGYSREEFLAMQVTDIRPSEDVPRLLESIAQGPEARSIPGIWRHLKRSGEILHAQIAAHRIEWKGRRAELVSIRDITRNVLLEQEREALLAQEAGLRKTAEAAIAQLAEQNSNLRTAQRLLRIGVWKFETWSGRLTWSPEVYEIYGVAEGDFAETFEAYAARVHPDDQQAMIANYSAFEDSSQQFFEFAHRIIHAEGRIAHVRGVGEIADTPEGRLLTGVVQDITQQIDQDNRLHLLDQSVSRLNDVVLIFRAGSEAGGADAPIVYVNPSFLRITGLGLEEVLGQPVSQVMLETAPGVPLQVLETAIGNPVSLRSDIRLINRESQVVPAEIDLVPVRDLSGVLTHWVAVIRDMSEKFAADDRARTNEERYELLSRSTHDVVWDWDFENDQITWNENFRQIAGDPDAPLVADASSWIDRLHPDDRVRVLDGFYGAAAGDVETWSDEYRFLRDDGAVRFVFDRGFVARDETGRALHMVGSMVDITAQKQAEARLAQAEKLEALGQITGGVAHDFNNLLMIILGNAETLLDDVTDPRERRLLELVLVAAERGRDLTGRLLAFARRTPLKPVLLDLNEQVRRSAELQKRTFRSNIRIETDLRADPAVIECDPAQLELVLLNLSVNARGAMLDGGVLTLETRTREEDGAPQVVLTISDTGVGMDSETLRRCLEPFFTTKPVGEGVGLGLSMGFGFMAQSGGKLLIESSPGNGTQVSLVFPQAKSGKLASERPAQTLVSGGDEHILLVEDDIGVREHVERVLSDLGYRVTACHNADAAIDYFKAGGGADLILSDLVMPGKADVLQLVQVAREYFPDIEVLYSSGYPTAAIERDGRLSAGVDLLPKPYRRAELAVRLRELFSRRAARLASSAQVSDV
jgi:PAS domain S-box-containing protein